MVCATSYLASLMVFSVVLISIVSGKMGMTVVKVSHQNDLAIDLVTCDTAKGCNPYSGDTDCNTRLPILCKQIDKSPRPAYTMTCTDHAMPKEFYCGWTMGYIATTPKVAASTFSTIKDVDAYCEDALGPGWVTAEFHDSRYIPGMNGATYANAQWTQWGASHGNNYPSGGWSYYSYGNVRNDTRFWMDINDQPTTSALISLIAGLSPRMLSSITVDLSDTVRWICKMRGFTLFTFRAIAFWLIMLATIDRWLLSSM
ncbi:unnamed protein product, partial [Adineta steineri]